MKYIVAEVQHMQNDSVSTLAYAFDDIRSANAKFHSVLAAAALSGLPVHSAVMFTENGVFIKGEDFTTEPEPETDESSIDENG